jgi:hypothetical protein
VLDIRVVACPPAESDTRLDTRQEQVANTATLGVFRTQPDAIPGPPLRGMDIPDIHAYDLGQPETGPLGKGVDQVIPVVAGNALSGAGQRQSATVHGS